MRQYLLFLSLAPCFTFASAHYIQKVNNSIEEQVVQKDISHEQIVSENSQVLITEAYTPPQPADTQNPPPPPPPTPMFLMGAGPDVRHGANFDITIEYLLWQKTDGVQIINNGIGISPLGANETVLDRGTTKFFSHGFQSGVRAGIGVDFAHDNWDMQFVYTWMHSSNSHTYAPNAGQGFTTVGGIEDVDYVSSTTNLGTSYGQNTTLNAWDWNLGRLFYVSPHLTLRPNIGVMTTYIPSSIRVNASYAYTGSAFVNTNLLKSRGHQIGVGTKIGCEGNWYFARQWSVKGNYFVSGLWTSHRGKGMETLTTAAGTFDNVNAKYSTSRFTIWQQFFLGVMWDTFLSHKKSQLQFYAGWEFNGGFTNLYRFGAGIVEESMAFQGLTIGGKISF